VVLHGLCSQCTKLASENRKRLQTYILDVENFGEYNANYRNKSYSHRPTLHTITSLRKSAQGGCHLCSLFLAESIRRNMTESQPSRLEFSLSFDELDGGLALRHRREKGFFSFLTFSMMKRVGEKIVRMLVSVLC
jgi:hypothetical protein